MKKQTIISVSLFLLAALLPNVHRMLNNEHIYKFHPFPFSNMEISLQWYVKDLGDLFSYSLVMLLVLFLLRVVEKHLEGEQWKGHDKILSFIKVWERVFNITFIISIFDIAHYLLSFKQTEWLYLVMNGIFWIMTCYYLFKLKKR